MGVEVRYFWSDWEKTEKFIVSWSTNMILCGLMESTTTLINRGAAEPHARRNTYTQGTLMTHHLNFPARMGKAVLAGSLGIAMAFSLGMPAYAAIDPDMVQDSSQVVDDSLTAAMRNAEGNVTAFVQFKGEGAFWSTPPANVQKGQADPIPATAAVKGIEADVEGKANDVASEVNGDILYTTHNALRGVAVTADAEKLRELTNLSLIHI